MQTFTLRLTITINIYLVDQQLFVKKVLAVGLLVLAKRTLKCGSVTRYAILELGNMGIFTWIMDFIRGGEEAPPENETPEELTKRRTTKSP